MITPLIVANWKMHGGQSDCASLARQVAGALRRQPVSAQVVLAPPFTALAAVRRALAKSPVQLAGQNCHWETQGAFTGEVSAAMLHDSGCAYVIVGHSERRHIFHETDAAIARKLPAVLRQSMRAIVCVGETLDERQNQKTAAVIRRQLRIALKGLAKADIANIEIAYEPVWAIGTGQTATPKQISQVHGQIRQWLTRWLGPTVGKQPRILYGGSVNPSNVLSIASSAAVDGLLVGGASLKIEAFLPIVRAYLKK